MVLTLRYLRDQFLSSYDADRVSPMNEEEENRRLNLRLEKELRDMILERS